MKYINTYNTELDYTGDSARLYPNVSYVKATNEVKWMRNNPSPEPGPTPTPTPTDNLSAKYTTTSANETVQIVWSQQSFSGITIDGTPQTITGEGEATEFNYTFTTAGEHEVVFELPNNSKITSVAFRNCDAMTSINIPSTVTQIGHYVFENCTALASIICLATTPPTIQSSTFLYVPADCAIYVPTESVNAYKAAANWSSRAAYIQPIQ